MVTLFFQRCKRAWRHLRSAGTGRSLFPAEALDQITLAIAAGELRHRGELRLIVERAMPSEAIWADVGNRQRAIALFAEYGVWDTEDNCGVLIYINLADHKVDIVVDRGIGRAIGPEVWQAVCREMTTAFAQGEFTQSTLAAVEQVNKLLADHFPAIGARLNELPDHPLVL